MAMTRAELADAIATSAIECICQPKRCEALIRALAKLAKDEEFCEDFPEPVYERGPDGKMRLASDLENAEAVLKAIHKATEGLGLGNLIHEGAEYDEANLLLIEWGSKRGD